MSRGRVVYDTNNLDYAVEDHTGDSDEAFEDRLAELDDGWSVETEYGVRIVRADGARRVFPVDGGAEAQDFLCAVLAELLPTAAEIVTRELHRSPWQSEAERAAVDALLAPGREPRCGCGHKRSDHDEARECWGDVMVPDAGDPTEFENAEKCECPFYVEGPF